MLDPVEQQTRRLVISDGDASEDQLAGLSGGHPWAVVDATASSSLDNERIPSAPVRGRAPWNQLAAEVTGPPWRGPMNACRTGLPGQSWPLGEPREVGLALLHVGVPALLRFFRQVVEEGGVAGQLLDAGQPVGVEVGRGQVSQRRPSPSRPWT